MIQYFFSKQYTWWNEMNEGKFLFSKKTTSRMCKKKHSVWSACFECLKGDSRLLRLRSAQVLAGWQPRSLLQLFESLCALRDDVYFRFAKVPNAGLGPICGTFCWMWFVGLVIRCSVATSAAIIRTDGLDVEGVGARCGLQSESESGKHFGCLFTVDFSGALVPSGLLEIGPRNEFC